MIQTKHIVNIMLIWMFLGMTLVFSKTIRIMPLGDSITYGVTTEHVPKRNRTGYRSYLYYKLKDLNSTFDFVGSLQTGSSVTPKFDADHEGHPGWTSHAIAEKTYAFMNHSKPDIVLLHIGHNDHSVSTSGVESILNEIDHYERSSGHPVRVIVALIIDRQSPDPIIAGFNRALQKMCISRWENGDILSLVNMYRDAKLTSKDYATGGIHPNSSGYRKMANVWFKEIKTPYVKFSSAPDTKDDNVTAETGTTVTINILQNDKDRQNDMNISSVNFLGVQGTNKQKLFVKGEGTWTVDEMGIVTFKPKQDFTANPTPIKYTVKDNEKSVSKPAKIFINYNNTSLMRFPYTLVDESHIESTSINKSSNSIEVIVRVPNSGITF